MALVHVEKTAIAVDEWVKSTGDINAKYPNDDWCPLQMLCSLSEGGPDTTQALISKGSDVNVRSGGYAVPSISPLHIAVRREKLDFVEMLLRARADVNIQDQYGFTPLHYAMVTRNKDIISLLVSRGATASIASKSGSTALDIARALKYTDAEDILLSKISTEKNPSMPQFRKWLCHIGAGAYVNRFIEAGYCLPFVAEHGLVDRDLDCVGIPAESKEGVRRQLLSLFEIEKFYTKVVPVKKVSEEDEGDETESGDEEEEEDEEDED